MLNNTVITVLRNKFRMSVEGSVNFIIYILYIIYSKFAKCSRDDEEAKIYQDLITSLFMLEQ